MAPLKEELEQRLPWLVDELGFRITYYDYSPLAMGSSTVLLESSLFRLKFTNDRGLMDVYVASLSEPERWMGLQPLWSSLTGKPPNPTMDGWGCFLRDHISELSEALGPKFPDTKRAFERDEKERSENIDQYLAQAAVPRRGRRILRRVYNGPLGWFIAVAFVLWEIIKS